MTGSSERPLVAPVSSSVHSLRLDVYESCSASLQGNELRPHDIKPLTASPSPLALLRHRASKRMCDGQLSFLLHARFELWVIAVALCCRWKA